MDALAIQAPISQAFHTHRLKDGLTQRETIPGLFAGLSVQLRIDAAAALSREPDVQIALCNGSDLWLINRGAKRVELTHQELFGFNVGSFSEVAVGESATQQTKHALLPNQTWLVLAGSCAGSADILPWLVKDDRTLVCLVATTPDGPKKEVMSVAEVMCKVTRDRGVTEVQIVDHDARQRSKAFRHKQKTATLRAISFEQALFLFIDAEASKETPLPTMSLPRLDFGGKGWLGCSVTPS